MKTFNRNKLIGLALTGSLSLFSASGVFAAANDDISNRATLSFPGWCSTSGTGVS